MNSVFIPLKISLVFQGQKAVNPDNVLECSQPPDPSHGLTLRLLVNVFNCITSSRLLLHYHC